MTTEFRPIRSEADYEAALALLDDLWEAASGTPDGDSLDVLATLIEAYEIRHEPMDPPDPIGAILFRMEQQGLDRKHLEPTIGHRGRVAEVLGRKRPLTLGDPAPVRRARHCGRNPDPRAARSGCGVTL